MATHSSVLAWRIQYTEEPFGLWSTGSQRVRHNRATKHTSYTAAAFMLASGYPGLEIKILYTTVVYTALYSRLHEAQPLAENTRI